MLLANSKLYKNNRTTVPIEVREKYGINGGDEVTILWHENKKGETLVSFRKKIKK